MSSSWQSLNPHILKNKQNPTTITFCLQWDWKAPEDELSQQNNPNLPEQFTWLRCSSSQPYFPRNAQKQTYFSLDKLLWQAAPAALLWVEPPISHQRFGNGDEGGEAGSLSPWGHPARTPPCCREDAGSQGTGTRTSQAHHGAIPGRHPQLFQGSSHCKGWAAPSGMASEASLLPFTVVLIFSD